MTEPFNTISNYVNLRNNGWRILIHKTFQSTDLIPAICQQPHAAEKVWERVGSSDAAKVYRWPIIVENETVVLYVKEYFPRSAMDQFKHLLRPSRAMRAFSAGMILEANGLHSPDIVALLEKRTGPVCGRNLLITCEMKNARPFNTLVGGERPSENDPAFNDRRRMITELGETVGKMHASGIFHGDLRSGNIFVSGGQADRTFYLIDNERTMQYRHIPSRLRIKNLVQLNMLGSVSATERMRFYNAYTAAAGINNVTAKSIASNVISKTQQRLKNRARGRIGGTGKNDHWHFERGRQGNCSGIFFRKFCQRPGTAQFIQAIESLMETGRVLKDDRSTRVVHCTWNGWEIVIKRYNHQGLWHSLRHTIKGSRARKCWQFGHRLNQHGIATAKPLGYLEQRKFGLIWQSYIINQYIEGPQLHAVMNLPGYSPEEREVVMEKAEQLLASMGRHRLTHSDMKPANMLICEGKPVLIDLDSMERHRIRWYFMYRYHKMVNYFHHRLHGKKKRTTH